MIKRSTRIAQPVPALCPECYGHVEAPAAERDGLLAVCPHCAAVMATTPDGRWRPLMTEEWYATLCSPGFAWLWDRRVEVMNAITDPARTG